MAEKVANALGGSIDGKNIGVLGLAFKGNTDDCRESPALAIIKVMQEMGANITVFDPAAMPESKHHISNISYVEDKYDVCNNADALVILTEWDEFKELDLELVKSKLKLPVVVDLRNLYNPNSMSEFGIIYHSIGRP
jgi:UDPglucose 6-dehydrogenase